MKILKKFTPIDLTKLSEEELKNHCMEVRSNINKSKRMNIETKDLEIYFCYVIRELENRNYIVQNKIK